MHAVDLGVLNLILLVLTHGVPLLAHIAYDITHSPGWVILLEVCLATLNVHDEGRYLLLWPHHLLRHLVAVGVLNRNIGLLLLIGVWVVLLHVR